MGIGEDIKQKSFKSEYTKLVINLIYTQAWLSQHQHTLFKPHGLTVPQYNILRILRGQHPKPATINLLISRMLDKSSNASRIVDKLEQKGLVERRQCNNDRRAVDVIITEKGLDLLKKLDGVVDAWEKDTCKLPEEDARQLNDLLDKLRSNHKS
jgi:DNA-binding MarR family transcriptional regulator